jgi:hypothetical protein
MHRFLYFLAIIFIPVIFSWWLFIPLALLAVFLARLPYEIILAGFILDSFYYFGNGFLNQHLLTLFSIVLIILAWFLSKKIYWRKII